MVMGFTQLLSKLYFLNQNYFTIQNRNYRFSEVSVATNRSLAIGKK